MALYLALVVAAEFVTVDGHLSSKSSALGLLWGTAIGLTLAHIFAFNLSALVISMASMGARRDAVVWQVGASVIVATVLSLPFLLLDIAGALSVDRFLLAAFLGATGWAVARNGGASGIRALAVGLFLLGVGIVVILVKSVLAAH